MTDPKLPPFEGFPRRKKQKKKVLDPKLVGIFDDLVDESVVAKIKEDAPKPREIARQLIMFWRQEKCQRCHHVYEGSHYGMEVMLQLEMQKPIVYFGRFFGWKYVGIRFHSVPDLACYDHLPRKVELIKTTCRVCPRCIHKADVIYLPQLEA